MKSVSIVGLALMLWAGSSQALTLTEAEELALAAEIRHEAYTRQAGALREQAAAAGALEDPRLTVAARGYPVDTLDPAVGGMAQTFVGLNQRFPAPGVRTARSELEEARAGGYDARARLSVLETLRQVRLLWTELWYWYQSGQVARDHEEHFRQRRDSVQAAYRSGGASQQALFQVRTGLQRVRESRMEAEQKGAEVRRKLERWLNTEVPELKQLELPEGIDELDRVPADHPELRIAAARADRHRREQELARKSARPDWGLELGYGFRAGNDDMGRERPDMVSLGVSLELPVFAGGRDLRREKAAALKAEAALSERDDTLRDLRMRRERAGEELQGLEQRLSLMEEQWLPSARREAQTTLQSYQAGSVPFSDVIDTRMRLLETRLQYDRLKADRARARVQLRFLSAVDLKEYSS
jgi:outer membrane protein TolC